MAHVGEKARLGLHRGFGGLPRPFQQLGRAFLVGNIRDHRRDAGHGAVFGQQRRLGDQHVVGGAVARLYRGLVTQRLARLEHLVVALAVILIGRPVRRAGEEIADGFFARHADHLLPGGVHQCHAPLGVAQDHRQGQRLEQRLHDAQGVRQRALHLLARSDVGVRAGHAQRAPVRVALGDVAVGLDPHPATIGMTRAMTDFESGRDTAQCGARRFGECGAIFFVHQRHDVFDAHDRCLRADTEESQHVTVGVDVPGGEIPLPQSEVGRLQCGFEPFVADEARPAVVGEAVDQREASIAQDFDINRFSRTQVCDESVHVGLRPEPEGPRQLIFQLAIHLINALLGATPDRATPVFGVGSGGDY